MTETERVEKIISATKDINILESLLKSGKFLKAENTITKIVTNIDYADTVFLSRAKHNIPYGNTSFGSLSYTQQRNVIIMLLEAVEATLIKLSLPNDKEDK